MLFLGGGRLIQPSQGLNDDSYWVRYEWYKEEMQWRTDYDIETNLFLLNMGPVLGIKLEFILGNAD